jgi:hypothetical protein
MSTHAIDDYNLGHPSRPPHHIFVSMLLRPCLAPPCPFSPSKSLVSPSLCHPRKCRSHSILIRYDTITYLSSIASSKIYRIIHDNMSNRLYFVGALEALRAQSARQCQIQSRHYAGLVSVCPRGDYRLYLSC